MFFLRFFERKKLAAWQHHDFGRWWNSEKKVEAWAKATVDGRNPAPVEVGSLYHYLHDFIHLRWCRISSTNSISGRCCCCCCCCCCHLSRWCLGVNILVRTSIFCGQDVDFMVTSLRFKTAIWVDGDVGFETNMNLGFVPPSSCRKNTRIRHAFFWFRDSYEPLKMPLKLGGGT